MKMLNLKSLGQHAPEVLTRAQLKKIMTGVLGGSGSQIDGACVANCCTGTAKTGDCAAVGGTCSYGPDPAHPGYDLSATCQVGGIYLHETCK